MDGTLGFYDSDPEGYAYSTLGRDVSALRGMFASRLPDGARVLDLGCGSGRDSKAFTDMGFDVVPVDGSEGMCRVASELLGRPVRCLLFSELDYEEGFDGVWACASLLHVRPEGLQDVMGRVHRALRPRGMLFVSFKSGSFAGMRDGRWYTDLDEDGVRGLAGRTGFDVNEAVVTEDALGTVWTNAFLRKTG